MSSSLNNNSTPVDHLQHGEIRLLDANVNRACEGLRVIEDIFRFLLDDAPRSEELKEMRHTIREAFPAGILISHRDAGNDVGQGVLKFGSQERNSLTEIIKANCKRVQESLRCIEEIVKLKSLDMSLDQKASWESLRYRVYSLEKELLLRVGDK